MEPYLKNFLTMELMSWNVTCNIFTAKYIQKILVYILISLNSSFVLPKFHFSAY